MAALELGYLLPLRGWPEAVFHSDFTYEGGALTVDGAVMLEARSREALERGVDGVGPQGSVVEMRLERDRRDVPVLRLLVNGEAAVRSDRLRARPTRSAWLHGCQALAASAAGFTASYLYLLRAAQEQSGWSLKMANHMAGWHLLLTLTLFPASVWGQRAGIRAVQLVSLLFFAIHAGIAIANLGVADAGEYAGPISFFNAASGALFLLAAVYGSRAYRDMDPVVAFRAAQSPSGSARIGD